MPIEKKNPSAASPRRVKSAKEPLTRDRIELAAQSLIESEGLENFSARKLGAALGCEAMSIYYHFPSKAHILDALVDRIISGIPVPPRSMPPMSRLRELAKSFRNMALGHPRFFPFIAMHRINSPVGVAYLNEILQAFRDTGLDRETAARLFRAMGYFLVGAALEEIAGYANGPSSLNPVSNAELVARFPNIADAGEFFAPQHRERTFELGVEAFLSVISARGA